MNVGDRLKNIPDNTVIHILSLEHWEQIRPYTDLTDTGFDDKYSLYKEFCIYLNLEGGDNYWDYYEKEYYISESYDIITSDEICMNNIHECW